METIELMKRARAGDKMARDQVIEENMGLVYNIVKRFLGRGYEAEDLAQLGAIGLIKAVDRFDFDYDVKFSTYAVPMITGEIQRFLRDDGMMRVSRSIKENGWKIARAREELWQQLEREPTLAEIVEKTGLEHGDVVIAMEANAEIESLHKPLTNEGEGSYLLEERIADTNNWNEKLLNRITVEKLMKELTQMEKKLIYLRYFEERPQREIAQKIGVSQVQVSRMEKKIIKNLKEMY